MGSGSIAPLILNLAPDGGEWSFPARSLFPLGKQPLFSFNKKHGGWARSQLNRYFASTRYQSVIARSSSPKHSVAGFIPQGLQLQAQIRLASRN
jgi:hypothetical protein